MKCPQCNSLMEIYDQVSNDKSKVSFYRCTICEAEHVASSMLTAGQFVAPTAPGFGLTGSQSQNGMMPVI